MLKVAISESPLVLSAGATAATCDVSAIRRALEAVQYETQVFSACGAGGRELEASVSQGHFTGLLDLTLTELADGLIGGMHSAGPDRLTAAALLGVPQVVAPGGLDLATFGSMLSVPVRFRERRLYSLDPATTLVRTTPEENDLLGRELAMKVSASRGPAALLLPLRGVSALDREGQQFWWPEADAALFQSIRNWLTPHVTLMELDMHISDTQFAQTAVATLLAMLRRK